MIYKLRLPLHLQPLHQPQHEVHPYPNVKAPAHLNKREINIGSEGELYICLCSLCSHPNVLTFFPVWGMLIRFDAFRLFFKLSFIQVSCVFLPLFWCTVKYKCTCIMINTTA